MTIFTVNLWLLGCGFFLPFEETVFLGLIGLFVTFKTELGKWKVKLKLQKAGLEAI